MANGETWTEEMRQASAEFSARRPNVKCAVDDCPYYRQDAWEKPHPTPAPPGWKCARHSLATVEI